MSSAPSFLVHSERSREIFQRFSESDSSIGGQVFVISSEVEKSLTIFVRIPRSEDKSRTGSGRRKRCRFAPRTARICVHASTAQGTRPARASKHGPISRKQFVARYAARF